MNKYKITTSTKPDMAELVEETCEAENFTIDANGCLTLKDHIKGNVASFRPDVWIKIRIEDQNVTNN